MYIHGSGNPYKYVHEYKVQFWPNLVSYEEKGAVGTFGGHCPSCLVSIEIGEGVRLVLCKCARLLPKVAAWAYIWPRCRATACYPRLESTRAQSRICIVTHLYRNTRTHAHVLTLSAHTTHTHTHTHTHHTHYAHTHTPHTHTLFPPAEPAEWA